MTTPTPTSFANTNPSDHICVVRGRPMLKEPMSFFQYKQESRIMLTITDSISVWQTDLILAERLFADMIVCPFQISDHVQNEAITCTRDVLKQRMRYPGIKEQPDLEQIAKTWVLPGKLHNGPDAARFVQPDEKAIQKELEPIFTSVQNEQSTIHLLKIEVANGVERSMIYTFLDSGFRPSLLLVKWSHDLDEHIATAHCAGHIYNSGYSCVAIENDYALYMFTEQTLYDICSMKSIGMTNPMMADIIQGVRLSKKQEEEQITASASTAPTQFNE